MAPARTGRDSNSNTAVITTAQPNNASLCNLIPGLLMFKIVVIKFIAPRSELTPDKYRHRRNRFLTQQPRHRSVHATLAAYGSLVKQTTRL